LRSPPPAAFGRPVSIPPTTRRARVVLVKPEKVVSEAKRAQELGHQVGVFSRPSPTPRSRRTPWWQSPHRWPPTRAAVRVPARTRPAGVRPHRGLLAGGGGAGTGDCQPAPPRGPGPARDQHRRRAFKKLFPDRGCVRPKDAGDVRLGSCVIVRVRAGRRRPGVGSCSVSDVQECV
jgi:hypothetical protein